MVAVPPELAPGNHPAPIPPSDDELRRLVVRLDAAASRAKDPHHVVARVDLTNEERCGPLGALVMAFQYGHDPDSKPGEAYFRSLLRCKKGCQHPPKLSAVPGAVAALWDRAASLVSSPMARARLHDLCFEGRWGDVGSHARLAGEAYLELADALAEVDASDQPGAVLALRQREALQRARALGRLTGQVYLEDRAADAIVDALRRILATDRLDLGRAILLVETAAKENLPVQEVDDLLTLVRGKTRDILCTERVTRLQLARAADDNARAKLRRNLVEAWMYEAELSHPPRRTWALGRAAALARDFGVNDLLAELTSQLQQTTLEDHGLVEHKVNVPIDAAGAEAYVQEFLKQPSWQDALRLLITNAPPTGKLESNRAVAGKLARIAPSVAKLPMTLMGTDGLPRLSAARDEDLAELRLIRVELYQLQVMHSFVTEILHRIGAKWGPIVTDELATFLGDAVHVDRPVAATLARAFNRYFQGDFEAAGYVATPQVERLVRDIVRCADKPAYRLQRGNTPGQYAGLGALLPVLMQVGVNEDWLRFLQTVFANTAGMNFRNNLLHGFVDEVDDGHAALALLAALYLTRGFKLKVVTPSRPGGSGEPLS